MPAVGIDLGTTYSAVAMVGASGSPEILLNREGERITPSVVLIQGDGVLVGSMAKRSAVTSPNDVVQFVKRQMGNPDWTFESDSGKRFAAEDISAMILKRLKDDAQLTVGSEVTKAVITVPAYFDDARRKATMDAGKIAGLEVLRIINEPTAAALAYGLYAHASGSILVYDLGGGTFDVTIMRLEGGTFEVLSTLGDRNLGGFDWDNAIMEYLAEQVLADDGPDILSDNAMLAEVRDKAEMAKRALTTMPDTRVFITVDQKTYNIPVSRVMFNESTAGLLGRTRDITEITLDDAGLRWADIDHLLLVGGSTRMPMVQEAIRSWGNKEPERAINPDEVVALGAAVQAILVEEESGSAMLPVPFVNFGKNLSILDVAAHGLGTIAMDGEGPSGRLRNFVLVPRNSKVPTSGRDTFETLEENQSRVQVQITEGDDPDPVYVTIVGDATFDLPPYEKGAPIEIRISYDIDGVIFAEAYDLKANKKLGDMEIERKSNLNGDEIEDKTNYLKNTKIN